MDKRERKNAKPLETRLYEEARKIYDKELMLISLDDHCIDMSKQKPKEISESRFTKDVRRSGTGFSDDTADGRRDRRYQAEYILARYHQIHLSILLARALLVL